MGAKRPTGADDITGGGLPRGRPPLIRGDSGSGKTLPAMPFPVRGIEAQGEPGVFMCFEERETDLAEHVASFGFDLPGLITQKKPVKHLPLPVRRLIGDSSDEERLLVDLDLTPEDDAGYTPAEVLSDAVG